MSGAIWIGGRVPKPVIVNGKVAVSWRRPVDYRKEDCTYSPRGRGKCALNQKISFGEERRKTVVITSCPKKLSRSILREKFHGASVKEVKVATTRKPELRKQESRGNGQMGSLTDTQILVMQQQSIQKMESILGMRVVLLYKGIFEKNYAQCYNCYRKHGDVVEFSAYQCIHCGATFRAVSPENLGLTMVKRQALGNGFDCPICHLYHINAKLGIQVCRWKKVVVY